MDARATLKEVRLLATIGLKQLALFDHTAFMGAGATEDGVSSLERVLQSISEVIDDHENSRPEVLQKARR